MLSDGSDFLGGLDVLTSPVVYPEARNPSPSCKWAEELMSTMSMPGYDPRPDAAPLLEFGMTDLTFADFKAAFDIPMEKKRTAYPVPVFGPSPVLPKKKLMPPALPCVLRPFASFEATELAVNELRGVLRRNEQKAIRRQQQPALAL
jgi:hypothetical protein